jgi:hypothetical protein
LLFYLTLNKNKLKNLSLKKANESFFKKKLEKKKKKKKKKEIGKKVILEK